MPSNYPITKVSENATPLLVRLLPTFKGWILRQGAKVAAAASAFVTGWITGQTATALEWCKANGASEQTLQQVQETFTSFSGTAGLAVTTAVFFITEMVLSRIAAKYPEKSSK